MPALLVKHNVPKLSRLLLALLVGVSSVVFIYKFNVYRGRAAANDPIDFHDISVPYLQLIPRYAIFYPWVMVTAIFAEISILLFVFSAAILYGGSRYLEKFWRADEVIRFIFPVGAATNLTTVLIFIVCNMVRGDAKAMSSPVGGGMLYYVAFLVVFKQLIPEHNIVLFQGLINFRVKHLTLAVLSVLVLWLAFASRSLYPAVPAVVSFLVSFTYLRFFQSFLAEPVLPITTATGSPSQTSVVRGDASDTFALVEFFPAVTKPYLAPVFNQVYELNVFLGLLKPFDDDTIEQSNLRSQKRLEQANQAHKSVANSVAERRRQVALQVIEDRINKTQEQ